MDDIIENDPDIIHDSDARRRLRGIMSCFDSPMESYETMKKIYFLSSRFVSFCYKAIGTKPTFKIKIHAYGFSSTPHTNWDNFDTRRQDRQFLKDMIFETAFRMLQQVFNSYPLDNTYEYIKHANTALARCRVCELLWSNNADVLEDVLHAKEFFIWFTTTYQGVPMEYDLYKYCYNANSILTTIYYYNAIYALQYDYVSETEALNAYYKLEEVNSNTIIDQMTLDKLLYDIHTKYKFVGKSQ